ncbi:MAG: hypothetical protein FJ148_22285 [Deltaproteobacteria bacterium]|nr:hypothetical protein [Deltaproteobacteria bacterium]
MQREVGPGALARLIGGALRVDGASFREAVGPDGRTRLYLAIVLLAAVAAGFATATEAVSSGLLSERDVSVHRVLLIGWALAVVLQFVLFVCAVWILRVVTRRPPVPFRALLRLLALSLAPSVLLVLGPLSGQTAIVTAIVTVWRWVIATAGLRVGTSASWPGALLAVVLADLVSAPVAELVMLGVR